MMPDEVMKTKHESERSKQMKSTGETRVEHSQMIALAEIALKELVDDPNTREFSEDDVVERALAAHPGLDRKRLGHCVHQVLKSLDPDDYYDEAEEQALDEQELRHASTLPYPENVEYLHKCAEEAKQKAIRVSAKSYVNQLNLRVMEANLINGDKTMFGDVIEHLGVEGFVEAVRAELRKDGHKATVTIRPSDGGDMYVATHPIEEVLGYFRREAEMCKRRRRERAEKQDRCN
jgi:hypothetical protein